MSERPQRVAIWLSGSLILPEESEIEVTENGPDAGFLKIWLRGLRDGKFHCLEASPAGRIKIRTSDASFAGEVINSLAGYLGLGELSAETNFPEEERLMSEALERLAGKDNFPSFF